MEELTKVFKGIDIKVDVIDDRNMMFDISGIANKFGKNITEWKNSKRNKEIIKLLEKSNNLKETDLIKRIGHTTKIHNKMLINFARFISPEFEVAADEIIYDILTGDKKLADTELEKLDKKLEQKDKAIKKLQESTYAKVRGHGFETVFRIITEHGIDISASALNKILVDEKLIIKDKCYVCERFDLKDNGVTSMISDGSIVVHVDTVLKILNRYNIKRVDEKQMTMDFD